MSRDIHLNIDAIVLHGLPRIDCHALEEALRMALTEELSQKQELGAVDLSRVKTEITLPDNFAAGQLGMHLAKSLSGVISGSSASKGAGHKPDQGGKRYA